MIKKSLDPLDQMVSKRPPGHSIITIAITKVISCPDLPVSERFPGIQDFWC